MASSRLLLLLLLLLVFWCRGDVSLPPGKLFINVPVWGRVVSRTKGTLTVKQRRWLVRLESRLVGRLVAEVMPEGVGRPGPSAPSA